MPWFIVRMPKECTRHSKMIDFSGSVEYWTWALNQIGLGSRDGYLFNIPSSSSSCSSLVFIWHCFVIFGRCLVQKSFIIDEFPNSTWLNIGLRWKFIGVYRTKALVRSMNCESIRINSLHTSHLPLFVRYFISLGRIRIFSVCFFGFVLFFFANSPRASYIVFGTFLF